MWPIDWSWYPKVVHPALVETLHTATLGTILAVALASMVALLVARNITHSAILNVIGQFILVATRSVHAIIWALFFVAVFGPGALAGTMAIAVHSIGFTGKFLSEAIEDARRGPIEALTATGASPLAILLKGYWPQVKPAFLAIAVFRWDINVRESAVLGLVGGGGLGMALETALSNLYWDQAGVVLFVIFFIVIAVGLVTAGDLSVARSRPHTTTRNTKRGTDHANPGSSAWRSSDFNQPTRARVGRARARRACEN